MNSTIGVPLKSQNLGRRSKQEVQQVAQQWERLGKIMKTLSATKKALPLGKHARMTGYSADLIQADLKALQAVIPSVLLYIKRDDNSEGDWYFAVDAPPTDCEEIGENEEPEEKVTIPRFPTLEDAIDHGWIFAQFRIIERIGHWKLVCVNVSAVDQNNPTFALRVVLDKSIKDSIEIPVDTEDRSLAYSETVYISRMENESGGRGRFVPMFRSSDWEAAIRNARGLWDRVHRETCDTGGHREYTWFEKTRYLGSIGPLGRMVTVGR